MEAQFWRRAVLVVGVLGFLFAALPAVLVRFTFLCYEAYRAMPPPSGRGPRVWDHSYYALVWHTRAGKPPSMMRAAGVLVLVVTLALSLKVRI